MANLIVTDSAASASPMRSFYASSPCLTFFIEESSSSSTPPSSELSPQGNLAEYDVLLRRLVEKKRKRLEELVYESGLNMSSELKSEVDKLEGEGQLLIKKARTG